jgi:hypothetical protein
MEPFHVLVLAQQIQLFVMVMVFVKVVMYVNAMMAMMDQIAGSVLALIRL